MKGSGMRHSMGGHKRDSLTAGSVLAQSLQRIGDQRTGGQSRILPEQASTDPVLGCPAAVFAGYGVICLLVEAYERGRTG